MLTSLSIQNYILIRELEVNFNAGLTTLTGETGAGKSILLGALGLILGNRAESNLLQDDTKKCVIEGTFNLPQNTFADFFTTHELDWDSPTIIRREIAPGGKSRAFINDSPVTISVLKELGEELVDIHSQHQTLLLASPQFQLSLVDA
ncbi:MAG: AAA family ATPase, partial [Bacteroidetes bacterium]|nr:AAA family ATPase [Bacteroidota bacterium]